jgi:hypothetical protein
MAKNLMLGFYPIEAKQRRLLKDPRHNFGRWGEICCEIVGAKFEWHYCEFNRKNDARGENYAKDKSYFSR